MNLKQNPLLSIISPVYACEKRLSELYCRLNSTIEKITKRYEIIFINDASPDGSWETIVDLAKKDPRIKGLNLSRNFGQHNAITAGLDHCTGDWVVIMDCDLQDQPEEIEKLYCKAQEGYQIVYAQRINRNDNLLKRILSKSFYLLLGYLTNTKQDPTIANYGIYSRKVIDSILAMKDYHRYFPTMVKWVGFKNTKIAINHAERALGKSSYSIKKRIRLAIDVIISFSDKLLMIFIKIGMIITALSFLAAIYVLILFLNHKIQVIGYTSLIISIWFLSGLNILVLGIVGLYVGKAFDKAKGRPQYLIMDKTD